jgi:5-formyltetrahydrofolate cyclo-ligase
LSTATKKADLRREVIPKLLAMEKPVHAHASREICRRLAPLATSGQRVLAFWPLPSEPDISPLLKDWLRNGIIVCLPLVKGNTLQPLAVSNFQQLLDSALGVRTPDPECCEAVTPGNLDLVLVPGLAFSQCGDRLGRGGGYYDRFLGLLAPSTPRVALAFDLQLYPSVPTEAHDLPVGSILTESMQHQ